ncbi:MAG: ComEC/Rec2 family competence protein [Candidatus Kapabacteria bacterium]|nr:ComEC/Rec2 family competence protein [Candidatus Kapabacteria bacterium]
MFVRISQFPALKILFLCALGYFLSSVYDIPSNLVLFILLLCLITSLILFYFKQNFFALLILCLSIGFWFSNQTHISKLTAPNKIIGEFPAIFDGSIIEVLKYDSNYAKIIICGNIDTKFLPEINKTSILLNINGKKISEFDLRTGNVLSAKIYARLPNKRILKEDFDESLYSQSLGVQWIGRAWSDDVSIIDISERRNFLKDIKENIRKKISILFDGNSRAVMNAMILGDKSLVSSELREVFSLSGTAHLLAVSGLHVGIIAFIIFFLLSFLSNKWIKFVIFSILTSLYVLISGLQESAIRAGLMCILVVYLNTIQRQIYPLNIVAFVFLILVIIKPTFIYSPGFQMSFASIGGIILFFKPIKNLFKLFIKSESQIIDKILSSFALTISASITVSPIVAYYFGVYSFISPISNLLVVPLMSLSLIFGIISVALSFISIQVAEIYSLTTELLLNISEQINRFSISLPFAYWKNIENTWIIILISAITLYCLLSKSKKQFAFRIAVSIPIFLMTYYLFLPANEFKIIPRDKYVLLMTSDGYPKKIIFIIDRKPHQRYAYDSGLLKLIKSTDKDIIIAYNGLAGSLIVDKIKQIKDIKTIELNNQSVNLFEEILNLKEHIPKII